MCLGHLSFRVGEGMILERHMRGGDKNCPLRMCEGNQEICSVSLNLNIAYLSRKRKESSIFVMTSLL